MRHRPDCQIAESLGQLLKRGRERSQWGVEELSADIGVPVRWIRAAEADRWQDLPDDAYSRIYLKSLCRAVGLDRQSTSALYVRLRQQSRAAGYVPSLRRHPNEAIPFWQMVAAPRLIRNAAVGLTACLAIGFLWVSLTDMVTPPPIAVSFPTDGTVLTERNVTVEGKTEPEVRLRINGKDIAPDSRGFFSDSLDLTEGLNTIRVSGSKRHSQETVVTRRIIVKPDIQPTAILTNGLK